MVGGKVGCLVESRVWKKAGLMVDSRADWKVAQ
jgi:hypothetical protein